jgi:glycosyltransferase involved in cell wall biosynthesis
MRILHATPFYEPFWAYGGMARASAALCRALATRGHDVTVVTALLEEGAPLEGREGGVRVLRFPGPRALARRLFPIARGLGGFLRAEAGSFDVVHLQGHRNGLAVAAARACASGGRPFLLAPAGTFPHHGQQRLAKSAFDLVLGDRIVRAARALVAVSEAEARDLPRPAHVVPNGVEAPGSAPAKEVPAGRPRLLFVGNGGRQKRGRALPPLLSALPEAELEVVGPVDAWFRRSFSSFGGRVTFRGVLSGDALASAYARADVVVHPAVAEAFGLVPFEAALAGTAAVVAGGHGCGEWYARAGGCVVPPDDAAALAAAVQERLRDPELALREASRVAAFARERLTWDAAAAACERVYEEIRRPA